MKKMFVTVACALLSLAAFAQQSVKSDEGKPLVFSKAEFVGNLTVRMIRSDTARIEIKQSQSESNRLDWGVKDGNLFVKLKPILRVITETNCFADVYCSSIRFYQSH